MQREYRPKGVILVCFILGVKPQNSIYIPRRKFGDKGGNEFEEYLGNK